MRPPLGSTCAAVFLARRQTVVLALGCLFVAICSSVLLADVPQYTAQDIGPWKPTGLNEHGQVVGGWTDGSRYFDGHSLTNLTTQYGLSQGRYGLSINNSGQISGVTSSSPTGPWHVSVLSGGTVSVLHDLGGYSNAYDINDSGDVVGDATSSQTDQNAPRYPALFSHGTVTQLSDMPGVAISINNSGQVLGELYRNGPGGFYLEAFLYSSGTFTDLGAFIPGAINDKGQIAGSMNGHAVLYANGRMTDLGLPTIRGVGFSGYVNSINDSGTIVGSGGGNALIYQDGRYYYLRDLVSSPTNLDLYTAVRVNNAGQIIALAVGEEAYLLTPVPEPTTAGLFLVPTGLLVLGRRPRALRD